MQKVYSANTATITYNGVFTGITGKTITLTIPVYFQTNNAWGVDGDIAYLVANNTTVTITQV